MNIYQFHPILFSVMNDVIVPGVNSRYAVLQLLGLECLGLICLLHRPFAIQYSPLFVEFFNQGSNETKLSALQILFDFLVFYRQSGSQGDASQSDIDLFSSCLEAITSSLYSPDHELQAMSVKGFSKLFLLRIVQNEQILEALLFLYFHPSTRENIRCRQVLSFFIQAFASSNRENQLLLAKVAINLIISLAPILERGNVTKGTVELLKIQTVIDQIITWTDVQFLFNFKDPKMAETQQNESDASLPQEGHLLIAMDIYDKAFHMPEHLKLFSTLLNKLKLNCQLDKSRLAFLLTKTSQLLKLTSDKNTLNNLKKFAGQLIELE